MRIIFIKKFGDQKQNRGGVKKVQKVSALTKESKKWYAIFLPSSCPSFKLVFSAVGIETHKFRSCDFSDNQLDQGVSLGLTGFALSSKTNLTKDSKF